MGRDGTVRYGTGQRDGARNERNEVESGSKSTGWSREVVAGGWQVPRAERKMR